MIKLCRTNAPRASTCISIVCCMLEYSNNRFTMIKAVDERVKEDLILLKIFFVLFLNTENSYVDRKLNPYLII